MALHPVKLPKSSIHLFRIVFLQKRLLKALADPGLNANTIDTAWVQRVWRKLDAEWVRKFCRGKQESVLHPLRAIAAADITARQALYAEFCLQNKVACVLNTGGDFQDISTLPGFTGQLVNQVKKLFKRFYTLLSNDTNHQWNGYDFGCNGCISNRDYKDDFCRDYPTCEVCPYCDGDIGTPELDHYLSKGGFPLLSCSPWNLVPVCKSCNGIGAKGSRPAITTGPPNSMVDWLHPFFRPASHQVKIRLSGTPRDSIPQLHSPDATEQIRLSNHTALIQSLSTRWAKKALSYFDRVVTEVNRRLTPQHTIEELVNDRLEDHLGCRGRSASSMVHAAVCQAILDRRPEYLEEFAMPNAPDLE